MNKKYKFTGETKVICVASREVTLHRIRALVSFGNVKSGDVGGWIEEESNLSHEGDAWVYDNAMVYDNAEIYDNANVCNNAKVYDNAKVYGNAEIYGTAEIYSNAKVCSNAKVYGNVWIHGNATVYENAEIYDNATVYDKAWIHGKARVYGNAVICGNADVSDNAEIFQPNHVLVIGTIGSRNAFTTFCRSRDKQIIVKCGCFIGTLTEFLDKVKKTHGDNHHAAVYRAAAEVARLQIDLSGEAPEREKGSD